MMNMRVRPMTRAEHNYCYSQSQQISMQTGLIGHLRGDMGSNGNEFHSSFFDFRENLKTEDFRQEFDDIINALRFDDAYRGMLKDRTSLSAYCRGHDSMDIDGRQFGFRVDTENHAYMLRLNPYRGEYNFYCYCYQRQWLDRHLRQAERGIRFITPDYKEMFRIPDGDKIRITLNDGKQLDRTCRYIDDYHLEAGNNLYHICEFAERMEQNGNKVIPLRSSLPEMCYSTMPSTDELIIIKRGEKGYYRCEFSTEDKPFNRELADDRNVKLGVSKAQEAAMLAGSMHGWEVPAADPKNYDDKGMPARPKQKDRGEVR